jgi:hypothetical protein
VARVLYGYFAKKLAFFKGLVVLRDRVQALGV